MRFHLLAELFSLSLDLVAAPPLVSTLHCDPPCAAGAPPPLALTAAAAAAAAWRGSAPGPQAPGLAQLGLDQLVLSTQFSDLSQDGVWREARTERRLGGQR